MSDIGIVGNKPNNSLGIYTMKTVPYEVVERLRRQKTITEAEYTSVCELRGWVPDVSLYDLRPRTLYS